MSSTPSISGTQPARCTAPRSSLRPRGSCDEENRQIALPIARRSAAAFGSLGDNIGNDLGINGENTLNVEAGTGSTAPLTQVAFEVTVSSPYASTTFVL